MIHRLALTAVTAAAIVFIGAGAPVVAAYAREPQARQNWGVNDKPQTLEDGSRYCALWYGSTRPMLQLQVRSDRRLLILAAPEFTDAQAGETATLRFPTGFEAGIPIVNADGKGALIVRLSAASVNTLLENLSSVGSFRVTVSERSVSYPVWQNLAGAIVHLRNCESQLPSS